MRWLLLVWVLLVSFGCARVQRPDGHSEEGLASFYSDALAGRLTANGERYDPRAATCAHRKHAFGASLEITVIDSGKSAICRVNDRGPYVSGRVVDVSRSLAAQLGIIQRGVARVRVQRVRQGPVAN